ncbi:MAG: response regulator [Candidatus Saccharibacteria bacterium]
MAKVMLVEDDNNLREIYQARLSAEGYQLISAKDGEEALALAVKEKPDLIICDVMMPKVSGFEMLDILRSTQGIQNTRVIVMTALSQAEDKARAEKLGADLYLVKSQVTLEDMARSVRNILNQDGHNVSPKAAAETEKSEPTPEAVQTPEQIEKADKLESLINQEEGREKSGNEGLDIISPEEASTQKTESEAPKADESGQN